MSPVGPGVWCVRMHKTTHFTVVDKWGNMVSYTNTIESSHGIGVFAGYRRDDGSFKSHGFLLNNELTDFNTAPSTNPFTGSPGYNDVQPNKRPRSSMTPTMIFSPDGEPLRGSPITVPSRRGSAPPYCLPVCRSAITACTEPISPPGVVRVTA